MKFSKSKKFQDAFLVMVSITIITGLLYLIPATEVLERKTIDFRIKWLRADKSLPSDIVIIIIDESALEALDEIAGKWPWPRHIHAVLFDFLQLSGAKDIVADFLFTEKEWVENSEGELSYDDLQLVTATAMNQNVFLGCQMLKELPDEDNKKYLDHPIPLRFTERFAHNVDARTSYKKHNIYHIPYTELSEVI